MNWVLDDKPRHYFLALDLDWVEPEWKQVTREQYLDAELKAGCRYPPHPGHVIFSGVGVRGKTELI